MKTKKNDFIEFEYTASVKDGIVFDTTNREEALKAELIEKDDKREFGPVALCIGKKMILKGLDEALEDKEAGKDYTVEISPENAFGKRDTKMMRTFSLDVFREMPQAGMLVNVDGVVAKVMSVAGGRAMLDFNSPLAGKSVIYKFKISKIIDKDEEKAKALAKMAGLDSESVSLEGKKVKAKFDKKGNKGAIAEFGKKLKEILGFELQEE